MLPSALPCPATCALLPAASSYKEGWGHTINSGDVEGAFASGDIECVIEGETKMGGQVRTGQAGPTAQQPGACGGDGACLAHDPWPLAAASHSAGLPCLPGVSACLRCRSTFTLSPTHPSSSQERTTSTSPTPAPR